MIYTGTNLKRAIENAGGDCWFFNRYNMKIRGDTMINFGVRKTILYDREVYELYRRRPAKNGWQGKNYFDSETFKLIYFTEE